MLSEDKIRDRYIVVQISLRGVGKRIPGRRYLHLTGQGSDPGGVRGMRFWVDNPP